MELNKNLKIIGGVVILSAVIAIAYFFLVIYNPGAVTDEPVQVIDNPDAGLYVLVKPARGEPVNFVEFTQEDLEKYPYVQKAFFSSNGKSKVPFEDEEVMDNLDEFDLIMYSNNTEHMKVGENYYQFSLEWSD